MLVAFDCWMFLFDMFIDNKTFFFIVTPRPPDSKPENLEAYKIKTAFFTHPTLTEIGRRLVSHYFLLTEEELAMWEEDPESFGNGISPTHTGWTCRVKTSKSRKATTGQFYRPLSHQCHFGSKTHQNFIVFF